MIQPLLLTDIVTTVFGQGAPPLRHFDAPDAMNQLLPCNGMEARQTVLVKVNEYFLERIWEIRKDNG